MYRTTPGAAPKRRVAEIPPSGVAVWPAEQSPAPGSSTPSRDSVEHAWRYKQRRLIIGSPGQRIYTIGQVLIAAAAAWTLVLLAFLAWWRPHLGMTGGATALGLLVGLGFAYSYCSNVTRKLQLQTLLSMDPGLKGCQFLLGTLPAWISLTEREKMEWLNRLLGEVWPYYDRGICKIVKEVVEPIIEQYRPPMFKRIFFQELTFGEAPVRVEGITVKDEKDEIDLEVDVRWCGDANISLGIDLPLGGEFTRLTPKVKDIVFVATMKVILKPLVEKVPGFAAAAVALKSPPIIKYRLDFGVLPGTVTTVITAPVVSFVDFIVNQVIVGMLLWPKRITVPILSWNGVLPANDADVDLEVERLSGRQQGVVRVSVLQAKELKAYDAMGKSDPFVEIFTTQDYRATTKVISRSLTPVWNEVKYLPVLEKDTVLRLEVYDRDIINLTSVAGIKDILQMQTSKELMGRASVPLAQFVTEEGLEDEFWVPLGKGDWTNLGGPGQGEGWIKLGLQYRAVANIAGEEIRRANMGLLLVGVIRAYDLGGPSAKNSGLSSLVTVTLKGGKGSKPQSYKTPLAKGMGPDPRWAADNKFTLYDVNATDTLTMEVSVPGIALPGLGMSEGLGSVQLSVTDVIASRQVSRWTSEEQVGYMYRAFDLQGGAGGRLELEIEFLPYW